MPGTWRTVRVFISSTFRDMHAERDHLVKVVFPKVREELEKDRVHLVDIDLRWGVTREQAENDQVLDVCLDQIDHCRPFFIGIIGERYGFVSSTLPDHVASKYGWIRHHTGKSITELEILHGVLNNPDMHSRALFLFRDSDFLGEVPEDKRRDLEAEDDTSAAKLAKLKQAIRDAGMPVVPYSCTYGGLKTNGDVQLTGLDEFGRQIGQWLGSAIKEELKLQDQPETAETDALADEADLHERFMESRLRVYVGRKNVRNDLARYADGDETYPCLVVGPSGFGKSAALAHFDHVYQRARRTTLVISHFIGASPRSTNLRDTLRRFCQLLKARFGFAEDVPEEAAKLSVTFRDFVRKVPADSRVLLVIDALNQLDEADRAQDLYWLPAELPPQVKVIVSYISDSGKTEPVLEAFRWRKHCSVQLAALSEAEQREIIRQVPSLSAKTLDDDQVHLLLSNPATANPLFLLVALEELRGFAPYERLNERIAAFPREGDTVKAIFTQVIERLAEEFNQKLVETVLTLLASARRGMSERELQELVASLDGADDLFPVLRQLRPYLLSRAGLIDFYHRNLFKAVRERHLPSEERQRQAHLRLAEYFNAQDYWLESLEEQQRRAKTLPPTPRPANVRKVDELPWQLLQAADRQKSEQLLTDLAFLEAKTEAGMVFDLAADFSAAVGAIPEDRPLRQILRLLEEALRRDLQFISRHPTTLFQCLWNSCWWYDCPEVVRHYLVPACDRQQQPFQQSGEKLSMLLECWRTQKQETASEFLWLRSARPPSVPLNSALQAVFSGHEDGMWSVAYSPNGRQIASGSHDRTARVWDADSGAELVCFRLHKGPVRCVSYSPDGRQIASSSDDHTVLVWEAGNGVELMCMNGHDGPVRSVSFSPDGRQIASGSDDGTVRIWNATNGVEMMRTKGHVGLVRSVSYSPSGRWVASGSDDRKIRIWDTESGAERTCIQGHEDSVRSVAFSQDGRLIASGSLDGTVRLWNAESGTILFCLSTDKHPVWSVAFSADGQRIAAGLGGDPHIRLWEANSGTELASFRGHHLPVAGVSFSPDCRRIASAGDRTLMVWNPDNVNRLACLRTGGGEPRSRVAFSPDGRRIVIGFRDATVRILNVENGTEFACLLGHQHWVWSVTFSPDGRYIASGSHDRTVRIWNAGTGAEIACLLQNAGPVTGVAFSPDGLLIAIVMLRTVRVWHIDGGYELAHCHRHQEMVTCVAFSPQDQKLATGSFDRTIRVWDSLFGDELRCLRGHAGPVTCVAFSPDGQSIASGSEDGTVRIWDTERGTELTCLQGHKDKVLFLSFSRDGRRVVSGGSFSETVRVYDIESGTCLHVIQGAGDVAAIANPEQFPFAAICRHNETAIVEASKGGREIAWHPASLGFIATHQSGRTWAGLAPYPEIFALERHTDPTS